MYTLLKKELGLYFNTPLGYVVTVLFAIFANFLFVRDIFLRGDSSMRTFFEFAPWLILVFAPAISMRIFAEEKRVNTLEVLLGLPVSETMIVLAKLLALFIFSAISFALTISIPITLALIGRPAVSEIIVSYAGILFMSLACISLSIFFSSLTKNQIVAFLSSVILLFFLLLLGSDFLAPVLPRILREYMVLLSPLIHLETFLKGIIDFRSLIYFLSFTALFTVLTVINLEKRD